MKKLSLFVLLAFILTACNKPEAPDVVVSKFLGALTSKQYEATAQYTEVPFFDVEAREYDDLYFPTMSYTKPTLVSQDDTRAVVSVELTAKDTGAIVEAFFATLLQRMATDPDFNMEYLEANAEEFNQQMKDAINAEDAPMKTMTVLMDLMFLDKDGKKRWVLIDNEAMQYGLYLQEPQPDYTDYEYAQEPEMVLIESITTSATFTGSDEMASLCSFVIDGDEVYHMQCDETQRLALEKDYLNKKLSITYDILGVAELEAKGDSSFRLYVLGELK